VGGGSKGEAYMGKRAIRWRCMYGWEGLLWEGEACMGGRHCA